MLSWKTLYSTLAILTVLSYAWVGWHLFHAADHTTPFTLCLFKSATGVPCPSCGTTRALLLIFDGQWTQSVMLNPLGLVAALMLVAIPPWIFADLLTGKKTFYPVFLWIEKKIKTTKTISIPLVVLVLLNWGWNILKDL